ncbi:Na+/H+ antiporter [Hyphomicrobium sp.]|uniref:Na+/H+ antiporter n=1 Tax=Hyphomicrobium sp. TaxID=82 RepID=UPI000FBEAEA9|nr:Na+/H+ antiporter [Hyphomicrobium sp.]RUO98944.1 MAG: Na+/H+ antiporter [Hyphomicrobium sp.]
MHPVEVFELTLVVLIAILGLHWLALRLKLPPAVALLVGGGALAFVPGLPVFELDPELVLVLFLPPLLMDGAYFTAHAEFRKHIAGVLSLAIGAVVFTTLVIGVVTHWLMPELPWAACFALGAIVSPPDAVSARAVLQTVRLPRRLSTLLEGESLLNDATGLVLFRFAVAAALTGTFSAGAAAGQFLFLAIGGIVVGAVISGVWMLVLSRLNDEHLIIAASVLMCWAAYIGAEAVHVSGVIATVTAGLLLGWFQHTIFSGRVRVRATAFWKVMVFIFEAFIFILIGLSLRGVLERVGGIDVVLQQMAVPVLVIVSAMTVARFAWVFGSDAVLVILRGLGLRKARPLGVKAATVLGWAGMRGVVTLAVALTLPDAIPGRDFMLVTAFAVILVTVVLQGTTLGALIQLLGLVDHEPPPKLTSSQAEASMMEAQRKAVEERAYDDGGQLIHPQLLERYTRRSTIAARYVGHEEAHKDAINAHFNVILAAVAAGRTELMRLHRSGDIDDETLQSLEHDLDIQEIAALDGLV